MKPVTLPALPVVKHISTGIFGNTPVFKRAPVLYSVLPAIAEYGQGKEYSLVERTITIGTPSGKGGASIFLQNKPVNCLK